ARQTAGESREFFRVGSDIDLEKSRVDASADSEVPLPKPHSPEEKSHEGDFHPDINMLPKTSSARAQVRVGSAAQAELGKIQKKVDTIEPPKSRQTGMSSDREHPGQARWRRH